MDEEKQRRHLAMAVGYIGLLLIGFAMIRFILVFDDVFGQGLILFGFIFLGLYLNFLEKRAGVTKKESRIISGVVIVIYVLSVFYLFFKIGPIS